MEEKSVYIEKQEKQIQLLEKFIAESCLVLNPDNISSLFEFILNISLESELITPLALLEKKGQSSCLFAVSAATDKKLTGKEIKFSTDLLKELYQLQTNTFLTLTESRDFLTSTQTDFLIPLFSQSNLAGLICCKLNKPASEYKKHEIQFIYLLSQISENLLKRFNQIGLLNSKIVKLQKKLSRLTIIEKLEHELSALKDLNQIVETLILTLMNQFKIENAGIYLSLQSDKKFELICGKGTTLLNQYPELYLEDEIIELLVNRKIIKKRKNLPSTCFQLMEDLDSKLLLPLKINQKLKGVIYLGAKNQYLNYNPSELKLSILLVKSAQNYIANCL